MPLLGGVREIGSMPEKRARNPTRCSDRESLCFLPEPSGSPPLRLEVKDRPRELYILGVLAVRRNLCQVGREPCDHVAARSIRSGRAQRISTAISLSVTRLRTTSEAPNR